MLQHFWVCSELSTSRKLFILIMKNSICFFIMSSEEIFFLLSFCTNLDQYFAQNAFA